MYYVFHMYMYYKGTLAAFGFALAKRCPEKVFRLARNGFKYIYPQIIFRYTMFYDVYHIDLYLSYKFYTYFVFDFSILQAN